MISRATLLIGCCLAAALGCIAPAAATPNVLIFYADDLGWGELGCQVNGSIPTPYLAPHLHVAVHSCASL